MKRSVWLCLFAIVGLSACEKAQAPTAQLPPSPQLKTVTVDNAKIVEGQTVYVPIYSHIYMVEAGRRMDLTATLSVRNTDLAQSIAITAVNYHDTNGKLVRKYLDKPIELGALAATDFVIAEADRSGGAGASFIVEWVAQKDVSNPAIEAVMINTGGNQGISFISPGRVIKSRGAQKPR
ncbi:DUF3124 domain-containing protein [Leptolyngbya sp. NIES-2104]|uniref:DUF3124 domain-containing protein n=1 Tax=Leptolyngbya sp. NIES-2104 TaxID=1552121 RepID=UPI0006EC9E11|nr:DUF3124 domain-containing protein [Leptolyngbya sp. NIES-2104]GAP93498.1 hypothetical protein NIES2104_00040 [Leptolyngbya sp. NIES-2104]